MKCGMAALASCHSTRLFAQAPQSPQKKPNILYLFSDEHRYFSMSFSQMPQIDTPNMKRMAREGICFDQCISNLPVCVPHRGILMSGLWPEKSTYLDNEYVGNRENMGGNFPALGDTFKAAGYRTAYIGKWHLGRTTTHQTGFDHFIDWIGTDNHWAGSYRDGNIEGSETTDSTGYNATVMSDQAIDWLNRNAGQKEPFFMMVSWNPPHWRMDDAPPELMEKYEKGLPSRPNAPQKGKINDDKIFTGYHAHIEAIDKELGRMLEHLESLGVLEDTIVIYTSDHGSAFGENGMHSKPHPFEETIRVPFLARWPRHIPAGKRTDALLGAINIYPTLCALAGIPIPEHCSGHELSHLFLDQSGPEPDAQFLAMYCNSKNYYGNVLEPGSDKGQYPFRGIRTKTHTFAVKADGDWVLYDNQKDPYQMNNLVDDPAHKALKEKMRKKLDQLLARAEDPFIPEEWTRLPLPERIQTMNQYYILSRSAGRLEKLRSRALQPYLEQNPSQSQKMELQKATEEVYDLDFFGQYISLGQNRSKKPEFRKRFSELNQRQDEKFRKQAEEIMRHKAGSK
ncbi:MAG: sulfatase-like hydrolase/transferase [Candidatus Sumerlaeia bacterium]